MRLYKTEGIVLRTFNFGEADQILTLLTPNFGKLRAVARGARKPLSRLRGGVQLFSVSEFLLEAGKEGLDTVSQAELKEFFLPLRRDLDRLSFAYYLAELSEAVALERERSTTLFKLLRSSFYLLGIAPPLAGTCFFKVHLLKISGFSPRLDACVLCGEKEELCFLSARYGGVLCPRCQARDQSAWVLEPKTLTAWRTLGQTPGREVGKLGFSSAIFSSLAQVLGDFLSYHLEKNFKSPQFLASLAFF